MSLYSQYIEELGHKKIIEMEFGFAIYSFHNEECYIEDIYILPEKRELKSASILADRIVEEAKNKGCKYLTGSVNTAIKDPTRSVKVLLNYGFKFYKSTSQLLSFVKEI